MSEITSSSYESSPADSGQITPLRARETRQGPLGCAHDISPGETKRALTWSGWRDLNPRPLDPQSSALPNCAQPVGRKVAGWGADASTTMPGHRLAERGDRSAFSFGDDGFVIRLPRLPTPGVRRSSLPVTKASLVWANAVCSATRSLATLTDGLCCGTTARPAGVARSRSSADEQPSGSACACVCRPPGVGDSTDHRYAYVSRVGCGRRGDGGSPWPPRVRGRRALGRRTVCAGVRARAPPPHHRCRVARQRVPRCRPGSGAWRQHHRLAARAFGTSSSRSGHCSV